MKKILIALCMLFSVPAFADQDCEKNIRVKLSQTSYTLNVWKHIRNAVNTVELTLPVSCRFYNEVQVGDDLLRKKFRWGSLVVNGTFGAWNLEVVGK